MRWPTFEQIRMYYCVAQGDSDLPDALFLLECDAKEWIEKQESKEIYYIVPPIYKII